MYKMKQVIAVKVIIKRNDEFIIPIIAKITTLKLYELPGQGVEFGEDPKAYLNK